MLRSDSMIPLLGGAYQARASIADYEICENLFPELNPETTESPSPVTHYPREGLRLLGSPLTPEAGRGIFTTSDGKLYAVCGASVYKISPTWQFTLIGQIISRSTPVSLADNGATAVLVDGSAAGYTIAMVSQTFGALVDATGTFVGSTRVDFSDTYFAFNAPRTNVWYPSLSNQAAFNILSQGAKDSKPDPIQTLGFNIRQLWLIGETSAEVWFLAGSTPLPYQEWPTVFVPYGTVAPYSLAQADVNLYWLSQNVQGKVIALETKGYGVSAISTRALEYEWSTYSVVSDVIAGSFQQGGHTFVIFHFPTADKTWAFDLSTRQWHRRTWIDTNGVPHRERVSFYASVGPQGRYPTIIVGQDWQTGAIYALDPTVYTDNGTPIVHKRSFAHVLKDMHEITHTSFVADFETGGMVGTSENASLTPWQTLNGPALCMRYSNDGGHTWNNYRQKGFVTSGHYRSMMRYRGLGMARDRVYELSWSYNGPSALQGAYVDPIEHSA